LADASGAAAVTVGAVISEDQEISMPAESMAGFALKKCSVWIGTRKDSV